MGKWIDRVGKERIKLGREGAGGREGHPGPWSSLLLVSGMV